VPDANDGRPLSFEADDGVSLGGTLFASGQPKSAVLLLAATAVPSTFYNRFAAWLAERGHVVLTFDYRGVGLSKPERMRGFRASQSDWGARDVPAARAALAREAPGLPLGVVGHSFGGHTIGFTDALHDTRALALVASQTAYWKHWDLRMWIIFHVLIPALVPLLGYLPGWLGAGEDLPRDAALDWARFGRTPDYLLAHVDGARERYASFTAPVRSWRMTDDPYGPRPAAEHLLEWFTGTSPELVDLSPEQAGVPEVGHLGFFRPGKGAALWPLVAEWLEARVWSEED
jgi:predicted alpha/beta hydrolase